MIAGTNLWVEISNQHLISTPFDEAGDLLY